MKISELIKKLQEYNTDLEVYISINNVDCSINHLYIDEDAEGAYVILSNC